MRPQVALDPAGNAIAVWSRTGTTSPHPHVVQAAVRPVGGGWQPAQDLSVPGPDAGQDADSPQIALDAAGNAIAVWYGGGVIQAAVRPADGVWQAPEDLSTPDGSAEY